jgi:hypothetical protein
MRKITISLSKASRMVAMDIKRGQRCVDDDTAIMCSYHKKRPSRQPPTTPRTTPTAVLTGFSDVVPRMLDGRALGGKGNTMPTAFGVSLSRRGYLTLSAAPCPYYSCYHCVSILRISCCCYYLTTTSNRSASPLFYLNISILLVHLSTCTI